MSKITRIDIRQSGPTEFLGVIMPPSGNYHELRAPSWDQIVIRIRDFLTANHLSLTERAAAAGPRIQCIFEQSHMSQARRLIQRHQDN